MTIEPTTRHAGICPKCGSASSVLRTTHGEGQTRRRRICTNAKCNHRWTTTEQVDGKTTHDQRALLRAWVRNFRNDVLAELDALAVAIDEKR